jgi:RNA 3'-terminal phosphate cyclase (ATP)
MRVLELDGAQGEGGGQILRAALALSMAPGQPFCLRNVRAGRAKPGLLRQHLTAVLAAQAICTARVEGAELGSQQVRFEPGTVRAGSHRFSIGAAGSTTLVLQAVWPALALAAEPSELVIEGGTHNPSAPPYDYLAQVLAPVVARVGFRVEAALERPGFHPAGGGRIRVRVGNSGTLSPLTLLERGALVRRELCASVSKLPRTIAARELDELRRRLGWEDAAHRLEVVPHAEGPGNVVCAVAEHAFITERFTGFGMKGVAAERVAREVALEAAEYVASAAPVGRHLADQLLVPLALARGGTFRTLSPSQHTHSQVALLRAFLKLEVALEEEGEGLWRVTVPGR